MSDVSYPAISNRGSQVTNVSQAADAQWVRRIADKTNSINGGKMNCTMSVTLAVSAASTTVTDPRIGVNSALILVPQTADACAAYFSSPYVLPTSQMSGSVVFTHANNTQADRTFTLVILA